MAGETVQLRSLHEPGLLESLSSRSGVPITREATMTAMHLVTRDGRVYRGLEAVVQSLRHRAVLGRIVKAYYVPGLRQLADLGYRLVARYRYSIMGRAVAAGECDGGTCHLHARPDVRRP
jgi:predicted DCC family thiol-disulfide oxidoreductase YuxK